MLLTDNVSGNGGKIYFVSSVHNRYVTRLVLIHSGYWKALVISLITTGGS